MTQDRARANGGSVTSFSDTYWRQNRQPALSPVPSLSQAESVSFRELADNLPSLCWIADADGYITWYNRRWHEYCGTTPEQMEGWGWQSVHDPAVLPDVMAGWTASIRSGEPFEMTFPLRGADGVLRPFLTRIIPLRDGAGKVRRWIGNNVEISRQVAVEDELRAARDQLGEAARVSADREAFLSSVLSASTDCIKVLELDGTLSFMSEGGMAVMEVGDFNQVRGCPWPDFMKDGGVGLARDALAAAREGRTSHFEAGADTFIGTPRWWSVSVSPITDDTGQVVRILSVSRDISELRRAREQQELLNGELAHRLKNTLSIIQAIARQTLSGIGDKEAVIAFSDRVVALSRAHDVLTAQNWSAAGVRDVAAGVLATFDPDATSGTSRVALAGPDVTVGARAALGLSLLLHELATNATKHGALGAAGGAVRFDWSIDVGGEEPVLRMTWAERGGPPAKEPSRRGFGSRIIHMGLTGSGGTVADYAPEGLTLKIEAPVSQLQQA